MQKFSLLLSVAAVAAFAGAAQAQSTDVSVALDPAFESKAEKLGRSEVQKQLERLDEIVSRAIAEDPELSGARVELVVTDLRPNRPTLEQVRDRPGLDPFRSISIGGAAIEGRIVTAQGEVVPVSYERFSNNLNEVYGVGVWHDAERAYRRLASNLQAGRYQAR
jgi:hypothetical protein